MRVPPSVTDSTFQNTYKTKFYKTKNLKLQNFVIEERNWNFQNICTRTAFNNFYFLIKVLKIGLKSSSALIIAAKTC